MNVIRAEYLGMCFGVREAIALALNTSQRQPLTVLGELVHNETVLAELRARNIRFRQDPAGVDTATVMITAHGASERRLGEARSRGLNVLEATCPLVQAAHRSLKQLVEAGYYPVIIGKRDHVEIRGMTEDLSEFSVVLGEEDVVCLPERSRFGVIAQTTQRIDAVWHLVRLMRRKYPGSEVRFVDTVCQPTKLRQHAAMELARICNVVIVVGGTCSNNTHELVRTCSCHCDRVYQVQTADDIRTGWFRESDNVGVTAGTSTPDEVIVGVELRLRDISGQFAAATKQNHLAHEVVFQVV